MTDPVQEIGSQFDTVRMQIYFLYSKTHFKIGKNEDNRSKVKKLPEFLVSKQKMILHVKWFVISERDYISSCKEVDQIFSQTSKLRTNILIPQKPQMAH